MDKEKLYTILMTNDTTDSIYNNLNTILYLIPEIGNMIGFKHNNPYHHLDVWKHTLLAVSLAPNDFEIRLALLLHDIGKPFSYQDEEVRHFKGHAKVSSEMAFNILKRLNFSGDEIATLCYLIEGHDTPITDEEISSDKKLTMKKFKLQCCDSLAHNPANLDQRVEYLLSINEKLNNENDQVKCRRLIASVSNKGRN